MQLDAYDKYKVSPAEPATLRHANVAQLLESLQQLRSSAIDVRTIGESIEGRPIRLVRLGSGPRRVLMWSQMHGNEPTHTAGLLDLISLLQMAPDSEPAAAILAGCTLWMIPMLNPDGAERWTRHNAQGIDINRDASALATPEGRILQAAVDELRPEFGFNLHNQNARSAVGGTLQPAAVSVAVPPIDEANTQTDTTRQAKQVVSSLLEVILPECPGCVSRYRADYMPRAFGESIQRQGVRTVLVEAGFWRGHDRCDLVRLHLAGLVAALSSIATGSYEQAASEPYDALPLSAEHRLFDCLITDVTIASGDAPQLFRADLGINVEQTRGGYNGPPRDGTIVEIGDLKTKSGIATISGEFICMPGRIEIDPQLTPASPPDCQRQTKALLAGVTTLVGECDPARDVDVAARRSLSGRSDLAVNLAFVRRGSTPVNLQFDKRGRIALEHAADLLLIDKQPGWTADSAFPTGVPRHVLVNGRHAVRDGKITCTTAGQLVWPGEVDHRQPTEPRS
jgi:hypothetical protein